jgi:hypothetical protein
MKVKILQNVMEEWAKLVQRPDLASQQFKTTKDFKLIGNDLLLVAPSS